MGLANEMTNAIESKGLGHGTYFFEFKDVYQDRTAVINSNRGFGAGVVIGNSDLHQSLSDAQGRGRDGSLPIIFIDGWRLLARVGRLP